MTALPAPELTRVWDAGRPVDLRATLGLLRRGTGDPSHRLDETGFRWAVATPDGDGTLWLGARGPVVSATAWGPGAAWLLEQVPALLGASDDWSALDVSSHPSLVAQLRRRAGLRLCSTGLVLESLVPAILEQKVTGQEARRAWRMLLYRYGRPAPGPVAHAGRPDARRAARRPDLGLAPLRRRPPAPAHDPRASAPSRRGWRRRSRSRPAQRWRG